MYIIFKTISKNVAQLKCLNIKFLALARGWFNVTNNSGLRSITTQNHWAKANELYFEIMLLAEIVNPKWANYPKLITAIIFCILTQGSAPSAEEVGDIND